jgi:hypothetical protein
MNKSIQSGLIALAFTGVVMMAPPISAQIDNLGSSDYTVVNTITGVCITITRWPGGDIGLAHVRVEYPSPTWTVNVGYWCDEYAL